MKKRTPYTEPYTPEEAAELATAMKETEARMQFNGERLMAECCVRAWSVPAPEEEIRLMNEPATPVTAGKQDTK